MVFTPDHCDGSGGFTIKGNGEHVTLDTTELFGEYEWINKKIDIRRTEEIDEENQDRNESRNKSNRKDTKNSRFSVSKNERTEKSIHFAAEDSRDSRHRNEEIEENENMENSNNENKSNLGDPITSSRNKMENIEEMDMEKEIDKAVWNSFKQ